jgi:hypothetical protein
VLGINAQQLPNESDSADLEACGGARCLILAKHIFGEDAKRFKLQPKHSSGDLSHSWSKGLKLVGILCGHRRAKHPCYVVSN